MPIEICCWFMTGKKYSYTKGKNEDSCTKGGHGKKKKEQRVTFSPRRFQDNNDGHGQRSQDTDISLY